MQVVILAGGYGTRISEESAIRPKPMVEIGGRPILWHIMKIYLAHGLNDFVICCGYKGHVIKQFFRDYALDGADVRFDMRENTTTLLRTSNEPWRVTLVDTGLETMTGGRLKRAAPYLNEGPFCCTYGDGVGDVDITRLIAFHREQGVNATVTAVQPPGRFGAFTLPSSGNRIASFKEKPGGDGAWINGGFFVLDRSVLDLVDGDQSVWEREPMEKLAASGQLAAFRHEGFWQPMDTLRDKQTLEGLWNAGRAPWKVW
ncbi:glucose-1-phosphate cytidylyltransferase [Ramlibacter rhizophilus]|uniref:Glucose-1-phosphate cytidylyltransferase n=1 Tax=Ramlibacter rhizophilus TaxID=1781167 RepID=A0A4Z0BE62_9BURK|nr:glucose-1-phosphate cytidylyltransferase [Ramlibacter rhizophilus]TFY96404.1 glucose-1-phosphate cytidylyltransferase [Ramlibacter rhizophilus]